MKKRVLSGMRPTGRLHLGNYLGAAKGMLELQNNSEYETLFTVVDIHAITTPYDPKTLREKVREVYIDYLSIGLDPQKSAISIQSHLADLITQLSFYFSSVVSVARMQHLPTFKEKVKQHPQNVTMALLNYPVLMAADILIYKAGLVPVGDDQEPHLEIAREIARKMNQEYGMDFPEPQRFATKAGYVPSLTGIGKMSKSVEGSYINLTDDVDTIRKKVRSVPTATESGGDMSEGVQVLFTFLQLLQPTKVEEFQQQFEAGTLKFVELKDSVAEAIYAELQPLQKRRIELEKDPTYVDQVIKDGAEKSRAIAELTVNEVREKMGLGR